MTMPTNPGEQIDAVKNSWCSEWVKTVSPRFNGSIFVGGGTITCSRPATMMVFVKLSKRELPFCTFHGNRRLKEQARP